MSDNSTTNPLKRAAPFPAFDTNFKIPKKQFNNDEDASSEKQDDNETNCIQEEVIEQKTNWPIPENTRCTKNSYNNQIPPKRLNSELGTITYKDTFGDRNDPKLPTELKEQFKSTVCELCNINFTSNIMAKIHYQSKNHRKNVNKYLVEHCKQSYNIMLSVTAPLHSSVKEEDPKNFFCNVCNIPLTSRVHAESHYMGKNHQRAAAKQRAFGVPQHDVIKDGFKMSSLDNAPTDSDWLHCKLCNVHVTCPIQMEAHMNGQKHQKKLKLQKNLNQIHLNTEVVPSQSITNAYIDLSIYRTPAGCYYCKVCDLSVILEVQFQQHLNSKKHAKKINSTNK